MRPGIVGPRLAHLPQVVVDVHLEGHGNGLLVEMNGYGRKVLAALDVLVAHDGSLDVQALAGIVHLHAQRTLLIDEELGQADDDRLGSREGEVAEDALARHALDEDEAFLRSQAHAAHRVGIEEYALVPPPGRIHVRLEDPAQDVDEIVGRALRIL